MGCMDQNFKANVALVNFEVEMKLLQHFKKTILIWNSTFNKSNKQV